MSTRLFDTEPTPPQTPKIFDAEKERNALEVERDSLKGFAKLTKKGKLQSKINRKNEEIVLLKAGLVGIAKRFMPIIGTKQPDNLI